LRQIDEPLVIAEVERQQLGMAVDAESLDYEPPEMPREKISQIEAAGLLLRELGEERGAGEELVAMRPLDALDSLLGEHRVERSARAAVAVEHENTPEARAALADLGAHRLRD